MQLHTCASRCLSTPYSISTNPGLISSQLVATVTEIDGSGATCYTSLGDSTISRTRQLTTQCCRVIITCCFLKVKNTLYPRARCRTYEVAKIHTVIYTAMHIIRYYKPNRYCMALSSCFLNPLILMFTSSNIGRY